jgi:hypothetical protein
MNPHIQRIMAKIEADRKRDYWKTQKWDYFHEIKDMLKAHFEVIDDTKHSCPEKPLYILEHTDYSCDVLYFCNTCQKVMHLQD